MTIIEMMQRVACELKPHGYRIEKSGSNGGVWNVVRRSPLRKFRVYPKSQKWIEQQMHAPGTLANPDCAIRRGVGIESLLTEARAA